MIDMRIYDNAPHLNGHVLTAIDIETTGRLAGYHEIIQIAVVPLDAEIRPIKGILPFYLDIAPSDPKRAEREASTVHNLNLEKLKQTSLPHWKAADVFVDWFDALNLPHGKRLLPLAHNWAFESAFLKNWLGLETMDMIWQGHPRDTMLLAAMLTDWYGYCECQSYFKQLSLPALCKRLKVKRIGKSHDALSDALACAELYKKLLNEIPVKMSD